MHIIFSLSLGKINFMFKFGGHFESIIRITEQCHCKLDEIDSEYLTKKICGVISRLCIHLRSRLDYISLILRSISYLDISVERKSFGN